MEEKKLNEIIQIEQLPKIKEQLQLISDEVDKEINYALSLEVNEETVKEVKNVRARLNKINSTLETKRKSVKEAILAPYTAFLEVYDNLVKDKLNEADSTLKMRINDIEDSQKKIKEVELRQFANEHIRAYNLQDIISFEDIELNITLSASMKSLKEEAKTFIENVSRDIELIKREEYSDEILLEYKKCRGNYAQCKLNVLERHKQLEEIKKHQEENKVVEQNEKEIVEKVDEVIAPVEIEDTETYQFEVKATKEQIKKLIEFMKELGVEYK